MPLHLDTLTPPEVVDELNKYIVGQHQAKRAVAIALRNRWRRLQLSEEFREEVTPKNILMIGPTGVGKTEIARRLARLAKAPFIKVEATKFTEVGYVGRDVDSIIRDLTDISVKQEREYAASKVRAKAQLAAENRILDVLKAGLSSEEEGLNLQLLREQLLAGDMDEKEIEIDVAASAFGVEIMAPPGMEEMSSQLQNLFQNMASDRVRKRKMRVKDAFKILQEEEAGKLIDDDEVKTRALTNVEQNGIVFIDEIDKVTRRSDQSIGGGDISREGVQRDLLPLVEGCTISTRYGMVKTNHVLFVASGAFHLTKPSDLIPELQGRLPIRVELESLGVDDFVKILTEPQVSLTKQYIALLATEGVKITFHEKGIQRIAEIAWEVNERTENIGARRLHTVMERLLEEISFDAGRGKNKAIVIDAKYVNKQLSKLVKDDDWSRYIL